jgi:hypothetical protein
MANTKISALTSSTTPLAGTEVLPIVQSSATVKVAVSNLTAGRAVSMLSASMNNASPLGALDAVGKSYLGTTRNATLNNVNASLHIYGDGGEGQLALTRSAGAANYLMRYVNGTIAVPTAVASAGVGLGQITFQGWNGTAFNNGATIVALTAEAFAGTGSGCALLFNTTPIGSTTVIERLRIRDSGQVVATSAAGLGYGTGAGGTVTQGTSRTTGVTLSKPTGGITMFSAAGSVVAATFTVTNTLVAATDTIILNQQSGTNLYVLLVTAVAAGSFNITFYTTGGVATDAPVINFSLIKGVTA